MSKLLLMSSLLVKTIQFGSTQKDLIWFNKFDFIQHQEIWFQQFWLQQFNLIFNQFWLNLPGPFVVCSFMATNNPLVNNIQGFSFLLSDFLFYLSFCFLLNLSFKDHNNFDLIQNDHLSSIPLGFSKPHSSAKLLLPFLNNKNNKIVAEMKLLHFYYL